MTKKVAIHIHEDSGHPRFSRALELVLEGERTHWIKAFMRDGSIRYIKRGVHVDGAEWETLAALDNTAADAPWEADGSSTDR